MGRLRLWLLPTASFYSPHCYGITLRAEALRSYKIAYLKSTLSLNSSSKNEAFSLNISRENEGQSWYLRALFWKYL